MQPEKIPEDRVYIYISILLAVLVFFCIYSATYFFVKGTENEFKFLYLF